MVILKFITVHFVLFLMLSIPLFAQQDVSIKLDVSPKSGTIEDTFILMVIINDVAEAEFPILEGGEEFDVDSIGPESSIQIINGEVSRQLVFRYRLIPTKVGRYDTPSARVTINSKEYKLNGIPILIKQVNIPDPLEQEGKDIYVKQSVDSEEVYVGQQVVYSILTYSNPRPYEFNMDNYAFDGFWSQELGKIDRSESNIKGKHYTTLRLRRALYPLREGVHNIPSRRVTLKVRDFQRSRHRSMDIFGLDPFFEQAFGGNLTEVNVRSNEVTLKVKSLPIPDIKQEYLKISPTIVGPTSLTINFKDTPISYGEGKSIDFIVRSEGNINPLSQLKLPESKNYRIYEETPRTTQYEIAGKLVTEKLFRTSIVPQKGGIIEISSPSILFFDPETKKYELARDKDIKFNVTGAPKDSKEIIGNDPSSDKITQPGQLSDEQRSQQLQYEEEGTLQKLLRRLSVDLLVLLILFAGLLSFSFVLLRNRRKMQLAKSLLRDRINSSSNIKDLSIYLREILADILKAEVTSLGNEELKVMVKGSGLNQDVKFRVQSLLDEIDALQFSGATATDDQIHILKEKITELV